MIGIAVHLGQKRLKDLPPRLLQEFEKEWPDYKDERDRNLADTLNADDTRAWAIYPTRAESQADKPDSTELPSGLIAVWPNLAAESTGPKEYYLLVWQRGAYRNAGHGRPAVRSVLEKLKKDLGRPFRLRVRLETSNLTGPGGKLQKAIWLTFFNDCGRLDDERRAEEVPDLSSGGEYNHHLSRLHGKDLAAHRV